MNKFQTRFFETWRPTSKCDTTQLVFVNLYLMKSALVECVVITTAIEWHCHRDGYVVNLFMSSAEFTSKDVHKCGLRSSPSVVVFNPQRLRCLDMKDDEQKDVKKNY